MEPSAVGALQPPEHCPEKQRRIQQFGAVVWEYRRMESEQRQAVIDGREYERGDELYKVRVRKDAAKQAVIVHEQEHGC